MKIEFHEKMVGGTVEVTATFKLPGAAKTQTLSQSCPSHRVADAKEDLAKEIRRRIEEATSSYSG